MLFEVVATDHMCLLLSGSFSISNLTSRAIQKMFSDESLSLRGKTFLKQKKNKNKNGNNNKQKSKNTKNTKQKMPDASSTKWRISSMQQKHESPVTREPYRLGREGYGLWPMAYGLWSMVYGPCCCILPPSPGNTANKKTRKALFGQFRL